MRIKRSWVALLGCLFVAAAVHAATDGDLLGHWKGNWEGGGDGGRFEITLTKEGEALGGKSRAVRAIIACTSWAAASILRLRINCRVICVRPKVLVELIESRPAMVEKFFSSGVATEDAMVSALAPARLALTVIVGKSTVGKSLTGKAL